MTFSLFPQRAPVRGRHPDDFYATPEWCVRDMLRSEAAPEECSTIIEPSCGDGAMLSRLKGWRDAYFPTASILGVELDAERSEMSRQDGVHVIEYDFLELQPAGLKGRGDVWVVGNPPFSLAQEFVEHSMRHIGDGSRVTFLLRLAFLAGKRRVNLYQDFGFFHLGVLGRRPSFAPGGGTDLYDYGWFTWEKGYEGSAVVERL